MGKTKTTLLTVAGTAITGFGIGTFLTPNKIVGGGLSGVSTILYHTLNIPTGLSFMIINFALLVIGLGWLGKSFTAKTMIGAGLLSVFMQLFSYIPFYTDETLVAMIFGSALYGIGIGLSFAAGASTGGTDIVARIIQKKLPAFPIGKVLLAVDGMIILASLVVFKEVELTLFGIMSLFIISYSIDLVIGKLNVSRLAFVITSKGEDVSELLVSTSRRGVTMVDVKGAYTGEEKKMLFCALKESEAELFQQKILQLDKEAFIVFSESQRIKGKGFQLYK